jgi:DNA-binding HxlR family transcriptional regulator
MLKRFDLPSCPVETALIFIGNRWSVLIVRDLLTGVKRFGELKNPLTGFLKRY